MLGTIVGVTGWSDEQNTGSFRFWAERRMPVGRLWLAKVAYGAALVALLLVLLALPSLIAARIADKGSVLPTAFRTRLFFDPAFPIAAYLWLWPVYGFAFGHLAGMLFRKAAVGTAVGVMTGGAVVVLWLPSLLSGGVHWYQLWIPPLLALLTARALVWSWALDQLGQRRALVRLGGGGASILAAMGAGIAYRVLEVPEAEAGEADIAFRATIPPFETNDAGREIRRAGVLYAEMKHKIRATPAPETPLWPDGPSQLNVYHTGQKSADALIQLEDVLHLGWPANRPDADEWLDAAMANGWAESMVRAARMPIGTVEDPTEFIGGGVLKHFDALQGCEIALLARGLQLQAHGKPEAFVESVAASLSLARNLRNKSFIICGLIGSRAEVRTHLALQRWLEKLGHRPDLLKEMLGLIRHHDAACPKLGADGNLPEQVMVRNSVNAPSQFVKQYLQQQPMRSRSPGDDTEAIENEAEFVAFAWAVPWEKERLRRLVGLGNGRAITRAERGYFRGLPGFADIGAGSVQFEKMLANTPSVERKELADRRASMLLLALRLHRADVGALPTTLDALVPKYLPAVPLDPYDDQPFRYRLSMGETIQMELIPAPTPAKPEAFSSLLGGIAFDLGFLADAFNPPGSHLNRLGALIGGAGHEIESNPSKYEPNRYVGGLPVMAMGSLSLSPPVIRMLDLAAGRGILWSIGPDKLDEDGKRLVQPAGQNRMPYTVAEPGDWIYVVPEPVETKR